MIKSVLITGANGGLGKECARQLALAGTEKIYLGCRSEEKAKAAKLDLEQSTGKSVFEILLMDTSNLDSMRSAVKSLKEPIEGLVMNAGGGGGDTFNSKTEDGVTQIFAVNLLGHVVLAEELIKANKLAKVALYVGSEAARGVPKMGLKRPKLQTSSVDEFASICDGTFFGENTDPKVPYGPIKYMGALWISSLSRQYPEIRLITVSPGGTSGTDIMKDLPPFQKLIYQYLLSWFLPMIGVVHKLEVGAKRFVDGLNDESYKSGVFYGSKAPVLTGEVIDQGTIFEDLNNTTFQDNANEAIHKFFS